MSRATIKSCKEQAVEFLTERQAIRIEAVENVLLGAIVFCIAYAVTAGGLIMDNQIIALAAHPANKDASAHHVCDVRVGRSVGTVFKASNGFVPAFKGMASDGYLPDAESAVNWIHDNHQQIN